MWSKIGRFEYERKNPFAEERGGYARPVAGRSENQHCNNNEFSKRRGHWLPCDDNEAECVRFGYKTFWVDHQCLLRFDHERLHARCSHRFEGTRADRW